MENRLKKSIECMACYDFYNFCSKRKNRNWKISEINYTNDMVKCLIFKLPLLSQTKVKSYILTFTRDSMPIHQYGDDVVSFGDKEDITKDILLDLKHVDEAIDCKNCIHYYNYKLTGKCRGKSYELNKSNKMDY